MKRPSKGTILVVVIIFLLGVPAVLFYTQFWRPLKKIQDVNWLNSATKAEQLEVAHKLLRWPTGDHHDEFLIVLEHGGPESVPYLIRALKWEPETRPGETMICPKRHCLDALRKITGHDAGNNYSDWAAWWDSVGHKVPASLKDGK